MNDTDLTRLAGAAHRVGNAPKEVDSDFLGRSGGSIALYVFGRNKEPAAAARELVSAGLVGKDNPMAIALQDKDPASAMQEMGSGASMIEASKKRASEISKSTGDRDLRVTAAALVRKLGQGRMSHQAVAIGFESIASGAHEKGYKDAAIRASDAFAAVTLAGATQRSKEMQPRPRRVEAQLD